MALEERPIPSLEMIMGVHEDFRPIIASKALQMIMARIEVSKKDTEALEQGIAIFSQEDLMFPSFSGEKRKGWVKDLKKALKKANKKKNKKAKN